jgi:hypothetical protein
MRGVQEREVEAAYPTRMLRSVLRLSGAAAFALLLAPAGAAPPPGLAYDELVQVVVGATPSPPGNFQADLVVAQSTPTPAPRRHGGLGGLAGVAGAVLGGGGAGAIGGAVASDAASSAMDNAIGAQFGGLAASMRAFLQPHLMHYAYLNGWERVDDVTAQTATIRKCDLGSVVTLDLAKQTYSVYTPATEPVASAPPAPRRSRAASAPSAPGTVVATLSEVTKPLGSMRIEHVPTDGYDATTSFVMSQATGSCRNGSAAIRTIEYLPAITRPSVNSCPLRRPVIPQSAGDVAAAPSGGCTPTLAFKRSGPTPPANRLSLYTLVSFSAAGTAPTPQPGASPAPSIGFLTERGNVRTLGPADAGLFEIPQGFTKAP